MKWIKRKPKEEYFDFEDIESKLVSINGIEDINLWLNPSIENTHDPYLLDNIEDAVRRIVRAIENNERICVSYDGDADGIFSGTVMMRYLKNYTNNITYAYSHNRERGIESQQFDEDVDLLIVVDSGSNEYKTCRDLKCDGLDIIILDHHIQTQDNPHAIIVNNQNSNNYPNKELPGVGVTYKTCVVLDDFFSQEYHKELTQFVGLGVVSDTMSCAEAENRYYINESLKVDNITNPGIRAIIEQKKLNISELKTSDIGFTIAPIVNACTRLDETEIIIKLLLSDDYNECQKLVQKAIKLNEERKIVTEKLYQRAKDKLDNSQSVIIYKNNKMDDIQYGYNGLLATKITDQYQKPSFVVKCENGICKGSGRGIKGINLSRICNNTGLFDLVQGHKNAFGVEFKEENIDKIYEALNKKIKKKEEVIIYDLELDKDEITQENIQTIMDFNKLSGKDAWQTKVRINNLKIIEKRLMGQNKDTYKFICDNGLHIMKFKTTKEWAKDLKKNKIIDVVGTIGINKFYNQWKRKWHISNQMIIEDWKFSEDRD